MDDPAVIKEQWARVDSAWKAKWDGLMQAQTRVMNWLFTVPGAGMAGTLTFASKGGAGSLTIWSLLSFAAALVTVVAYSAVMYYAERRHVYSFQADVRQCSEGKITLQEVWSRDSKRPNHTKWGEVLAWLSATFSSTGLALLAVAVLNHRS